MAQVTTKQNVEKLPEADLQEIKTQQVPVQTFKVYFHLITTDRKDLETHYVDAEKSLSFDECSTILSERLKKPMNNMTYKLEVDGQDIDKHLPLTKVLKNDDSDVFVFYEGIQAVVKEKEKQIKYDTITSYSFLDEKKHVKVYLPLEGIGKVPDANIHSRFLDRSFQIKINDYNGKNWIFAIPKTQCQIFIKQSKVIKKDNKLIIKLGKIAQGDNWFTLHKTKCVGEKQLD